MEPLTVEGQALSPGATPVHKSGAAHHLRIQPSSGWGSLNLDELWAHRELVYFLTWRDVKVRYKQTALGAIWAIIQPIMTMAVFALFFGRLAKVPSDGVPYPLFAFTALVPWMFFSNGLTQASNSLVHNANLLTKVYFPRLAIPISTVMAGALDFVLSFVVLVAFVAYTGSRPRRTWSGFRSSHCSRSSRRWEWDCGPRPSMCSSAMFDTPSHS